MDAFAPRLSFFFDVHSDFFEEIAKFRAARRIWARELRERFGARDQRSWLLRTHAQTAGVVADGAAAAQQRRPHRDPGARRRARRHAVAAHQLDDETYALPTEEAVTIALRTQQIIAEETGVASTIDPLGGSYFVEALTDRIEAEAHEYITRIDEMGGMLVAIEHGYPQREIADAAFALQQRSRPGRAASSA